MLYAIFGIPLTLFTITNLGAIMATSFRFLYKYICCGLCCVCCRCHRRHRKLHRHAEVKSTTNKSGKSSCLLTKPGIKRLELDGKNGNQWLHNAAQREDKHLKENFEDIDEVESFKQRVESVFTGSIDINKVRKYCC
jgi:hypothetical protein